MGQGLKMSRPALASMAASTSASAPFLRRAERRAQEQTPIRLPEGVPGPAFTPSPHPASWFGRMSQLALVEAGVDAPPLQQLAVRSGLDDDPLLQHHDPVRVPDCGQ